MIWADRVAIAWGIAIFLVFWLMWASAGDPAGFVFVALSTGGLKLAAYAVLPVWIVLRAVDFVGSGRVRLKP